MAPEYETALAVGLALVDTTLERTWTCVHCGYAEVITDSEQAQRRKVEHEGLCPCHLVGAGTHGACLSDGCIRRP